MVILRQGDALSAVPRSQRKLITPEIKAWWADPVRAIRGIADCAVTPNMGLWFRRMANEGEWSLCFHVGVQAGFELSSPSIMAAEVGPPPAKPPVGLLPSGLADHYRLVWFVDWAGFGSSGGLVDPSEHSPLTAFQLNYHGADLDLADTFVFGGSPFGDMLVYTADGRGGWLNLASGEIRLLGRVS